MTGPIIDIALVVIAVIALAVGLSRGLIKQLTGLLSSLVALAASIVLTGVIFKVIKTLDLFISFHQTTSGWFKQDLFSVTVASEEELATAMASAGFWSFLKGQAGTLYGAMVNLQCTTLGGLFGYYVATAIVCFVLWLVLFLIIKGIVVLIGKLLEKLSQLPVLNALNRILGAIWSVAFTYVIVIGVLLTAVQVVVIKFLPDSTESVFGLLQSTKLTATLSNTNFIGNFLANLFEVEIPLI